VTNKYLELWMWMIVTSPLLLVLQHWISRHVQTIFLLLTRNADMAILLNQVVFLPGVVLHEVSHWVMARILGVRTMGISVWPKRQNDGSLRLGYVHTKKVDFIRESLIGAAPLLFGCIAVAAIGLKMLDLDQIGLAVIQGDLGDSLIHVLNVFQSADLLIWGYILFACSNTMMPSASDRRAWPLVFGLIFIVGLLLYYFGVLSSIQTAVADIVFEGLRVIATAFTVTIGVDIVVIPIIYAIEWLLWQISSVDHVSLS